MEDLYHIYILRCKGNTLYTGIARDYLKRYEKHSKGVGAKYTKVNPPKKVEGVWCIDTRSKAQKIEYYIKKKKKVEKEKIIVEGDFLVEDVLKNYGFLLKRLI